MKLLLTSAGIQNESLKQALLELLGKPFNESTMVFIPTAAWSEERDKAWLVNALKREFDLGWKVFDIFDIAALDPEATRKRLESVDVIYVNGGNPFYLMNRLEMSEVAKNIQELLKTRVYVGSSAGSMVASRILPASKLRPGKTTND